MRNKTLYKLAPAQFRSLQDKRLKEFISQKVYPFSPYYRRLFDSHKIDPRSINTVEDLPKIPFVSKADFINILKEGKGVLEFVLQPNADTLKKYLPKVDLMKMLLTKTFKGASAVKRAVQKEYKPIFVTATTGTTNMPVSFFYTAHDMRRLAHYGQRLIDILGCSPDDKGVNIFPFAPHLAFWQTAFAGFESNTFIFSTGGGKVFGTEGNIQTINKVKPEFLIGTPNYIYHILKEARQRDYQFPFLKTIVLGASRVPEGFKLKLRDVVAELGATNVSVLGTYGFTEARGAWVECPTPVETSSGYHIYPDTEIFEVIDPQSGEVLGEGQDGELVYTPLDVRGSCVLRYRTGDLVKGGIRYGTCPHCGRNLPRISSNIARASNVKDLQISKIKGALVSLNNLEYMLDDKKEIDEWQIVIAKKNDDPYEVDEIILYLSLRGSGDREQLTKKINAEVNANCEVSFNQINIVSSEEIRRRLEIETAVKAKRIVDARPEV